MPIPAWATGHQAVKPEQPVVVVEPERWVVPPPFRALLVRLPQHDTERPSRLVGDAQKVPPRVANFEVLPPASDEWINPLPNEI
jgi:hypothetical protein